jgi:signal transduction histidine kinase/CheY-like chemotaxis protein
MQVTSHNNQHTTTTRVTAQGDYSLNTRVRLMVMISKKAYPEMASFVIPPGLIWLFSQKHDATLLAAWGLITLVLAALMQKARRQVLHELESLPQQETMQRWEPRIHKMALISGFMTSAPILITLGSQDYEFTILVYVCVSGLAAAAATYLTPVWSAFTRFFWSAWGSSVILVYWAFPTQWVVMLPVTMLYTFIIFKHAQATHRFVAEQIYLEERSAYLAQEYKVSKEAAENALKLQRQFLTTASHDLRQPVHAMGMLVETIHLRNKDDAMKPLLTDLKTSVRLVNQMFNSLLDLSRIESGVAATRFVDIDLHLMLKELAAVFREDTAGRFLRLVVHLPKSPARVLADPILLRQSLSNLLHNAMRYTQTGGILLAVRARAGFWQIEIWDTGLGVTDSEKEQIFSPFYRSENAWTIDSAGHGLGLSVVARCADLMGATYGMTSRLGRGSRFWLRLPAAPSPIELVPTLHQAWPFEMSAMPQTLHGYCLILEDEPIAGAAWKTLLETWGVQSHLATKASEAFDVVNAGYIPQVILCDQRLRSGESGFEVLCALLELCPDAHGAMISGEFNSPELLRAESEGYLVLRKPLEAAQLHALLSQWLPRAAHCGFRASTGV